MLFAGAAASALAERICRASPRRSWRRFTWAIYSVLSRRFADVPTDAVAGFCLVTSALAVVAIFCSSRRSGRRRPGNGLRSRHWASARSARRSTPGISASSAATSACSVSASYVAPLLSTLFLVLAGYAAASATLAVAALLIAGGGLIAAKDMLFGKS